MFHAAQNRKRLVAVAWLLAVGGGLSVAYGQEAPELKFAREMGPTTGVLGNQAEIKVPARFAFLPGPEARRFLEASGNITDGNEMGVLTPEDGDWFLLFEFDDVGYVKDDEKDKLDADQMMKDKKAGEEASNNARKSRGLSPMTIIGWEKKPAYNPTTHNLEWAIRGRSDNGDVVNHNIKILGRHGVMNVIWVGDPEDLDAALPKVATLLKGFSYTSGNKYNEFRSGDRIAEYGLTALVTGGAAAVLLKTGLLQKFWKLIVVGVVMVAGAFRKLIARLFGRGATA